MAFSPPPGNEAPCRFKRTNDFRWHALGCISVPEQRGRGDGKTIHSHTRSLHSLEPAGNTEHRTQMTQIAQIKTRSNQLHGPMITNERKLPFMITRPRASRCLRIAPSRGLNEKKDISRRERRDQRIKQETGFRSQEKSQGLYSIATCGERDTLIVYTWISS